MFRDLLDRAGIEQELVPIDGFTRQSLAVREESSNQKYRFNMSGPELSEREWRRVLEALQAVVPTLGRPPVLASPPELPPSCRREQNYIKPTMSIHCASAFRSRRSWGDNL